MTSVGELNMKSIVEFNGNSTEVNVKTITPKVLCRVLKIQNIKNYMLCDEDQNRHEIEDDKFIPELQPQRKYFFEKVEDSDCDQELQKQDEKKNPTFENQINNQEKQQEDNSKFQQQYEHPKMHEKSQSNLNQAAALRDNKAYLESGKIFFENITNGCIAVEEFVLLTASAPDLKLSDNRSLRVSILDAVKVLGKSYSEAGNAVNKAKLIFAGIPTKIRQCLETVSDHGNTDEYFQNLQNLINAGIKAVEENTKLFEAPKLAFIELEQSVKRSQKEEESKNESEYKKETKWQKEMQQIEKSIQQKKDDLKSMQTMIKDIDLDMETFKKDGGKKKSGFFGLGGNNAEDRNEQLRSMQEQLKTANKRKSQLQDEIDDLEVRQIDVKHNLKNAKTKPVANWQDVVSSLSKVISRTEKIEETWESLVSFIKTVESEMKKWHKISSENKCDNSSLINAALRLSLNSWVILQCCGIYDDIVKSHIIPLVSGVSSNFGLRMEEAKNKLSNEKTKAQNTKNEVSALANKRLAEAIKNLATISTETEKGFCNIFSTAA
jgi:hypothetical protein